VTFFWQSGLQAALGTCTVNPEVDEPAKMERLAVAAMRGSRWLAAWPALVLAGLLGGLLLPAGRWRRRVVGGFAAAAVLLLAWQVLLGFPLDAAMRTLFADDLARQAAADYNRREGGIYLTYTPWFALAVLGTAGALLLTGLEWWRDRRRAEAAAVPESCEPDSPVRSP
jgi:hypothetical protein